MCYLSIFIGVEISTPLPTSDKWLRSNSLNIINKLLVEEVSA